jgi:hypothetical protein
MKLLFWILCSWSLTQIVVETPILNPVREFCKDRVITHWIYVLLSCVICSGFWVGIAAGYFFYSPTQNEFQLDNPWIVIIVDGLLASVTGWYFHLIENRIFNK